MVTARGEKGSEACWCTSRTLFAENTEPQTLQPKEALKPVVVMAFCESKQ